MSRILLFASTVVLGLAMIGPGHTSSPMQESTGEYFDSSAIAIKVETDLLSEPGLSSMQISVEAYKDVVRLSGFANSYDVKRRAGPIAMAVDSFNSVRNGLVVSRPAGASHRPSASARKTGPALLLLEIDANHWNRSEIE